MAPRWPQDGLKIAQDGLVVKPRALDVLSVMARNRPDRYNHMQRIRSHAMMMSVLGRKMVSVWDNMATDILNQQWWYDKMTWWQGDKVTIWQDDKMTRWQVITSWFNISVAMLAQTLTIFLPALTSALHVIVSIACDCIYLVCSVPWRSKHQAYAAWPQGHLGPFWGHLRL